MGVDPHEKFVMKSVFRRYYTLAPGRLCYWTARKLRSQT